jgi:hypothetical protein
MPHYTKAGLRSEESIDRKLCSSIGKKRVRYLRLFLPLLKVTQEIVPLARKKIVTRVAFRPATPVQPSLPVNNFAALPRGESAPEPER